MFNFSTWLSKAFPGAFRTSQRIARKKPPQRLRVEQLEDRMVPTQVGNLQPNPNPLPFLEGQTTTTSQTLATFTDTGDPSPTSNYSATIDWGDGNTNDTTSATITPVSGNTYAVVANHVYAEESADDHANSNPYNISVTVQYLGNSTLVVFPTDTVTDTATASDPAATALGSFNFNNGEFVEGQTTTAQTLATFTDPGDPTGTVETAATDYSATVDWGDGVTADTSASITLVSGNTYAVVASHAYAEESGAEHSGSQPYTIAVTVQHEGVDATAVTDTATVTDPAATATAAGDFSNGEFVEGQTTTAQTLATFTDPGDPTGTVETAATDYSATIDWGDGVTADTSASITLVSGNTYAVVASHAYAEESGAEHSGSQPYTIAVTVQHEGVDATAVTDTATVTDPAATATAAGDFSNGEFVEGQTTTAQTLATFTDPGDPTGTVETAATDYSATVDWGDGVTADTSASITLVSGNTYAVVASHAYAEESGAEHSGSQPYTIAVTVQHEGVDATAVTDTATVTDPAATATAAGDFSNGEFVEGQTTTAQTLATFTDPGDPTGTVETAATDYSATIDWGDGVTADTSASITLVSGNTYAVVASHAYAEESGAEHSGSQPYTIAVTVQHEGVDATAVTDTATVTDPAATATAAGDFSNGEFVEGQTTTAQTLATFTDPGDPTGTVETAATDYSATVDWGDGVTADTSASITLVSGNTYAVVASHAYAEESGAEHSGSQPYTIAVTVQHEGVDATPVTDTATVSEVTPVATAAGATFTATEGAASDSQVLATFTDPGATSGSVRSVTITNGGSYFEPPTGVTFSSPTSGTTATGTVQTGSGSVGTYTFPDVTGVTITNPGSGYTSPPTVTFTGGSHAGPFQGDATATASFNEPASDFSALVDWGDGSTPVNNDPNVAISAADSSGVYTVTGKHTYADEDNAAASLTVQVQHEGTTAASVFDALSVTDPAVTATGGFTFSGSDFVEGQTTAARTLATFTDPGDPNGTVETETSAYSATINWGDGVTNDTSSATITPVSGNTYAVVASHAYAEESDPDLANSTPYTISVTVRHEGAADSNVVTDTATVTDPAVTATGGFTFNGGKFVEGETTTAQTLATFTDPGEPSATEQRTVEAIPDYSATIDWGDGHTSGATITPVSGNTYAVTASHPYAEESAADHTGSQPYTISVTVHHGLADDSNVVTDTATVTDPAASVTAGATFSAREGTTSTVQTLATFTDPGDPNGTVEATGDYTVLVDWGNGTLAVDANVSVSAADGSGVRTITGSHRYTDEDGYTGSVRVQVEHELATASNTVADTLSLTDPAVTATGGFSFSGVQFIEGTQSAAQTLATFTDPADPNGAVETATDYSATINWGDGVTADASATITATANAGTYAVVASHAYAEESSAADNHYGAANGKYTLSVTVHHEGANDSNVVKDTATVTDPAVTALASGATFTATEGAATSSQVLATFTDPGAASGSVRSVTITNPGTYSSPPTGVTFSDPTTPGGTTATGTVQWDFVPNPFTTNISAVTGVTITNPGSGYTSPPTVTFSGGTLYRAPTPPYFDPAAATASFYEPASDFATRVDWGASGGPPPPGLVTIAPANADGVYTVTGRHFYTDEDGVSASIAVQVLHEGTTATSVFDALSVTDPAVTATGGINFNTGQFVEGEAPQQTVTVTVAPQTQTLAPQTLATFTDPGGAESTLDYSATINWGDGVTNDTSATITQVSGATFAVVASHAYAEESAANHANSNPYTISVTVHHEGTTATVVTDTATVTDPAVSVTSGPTFSATEGTTSTVQTLATFTDPGDPTGTVEPTGDYTVLVDWGNGTLATDASLSVSAADGSGVRTITGSHLYTDENGYTGSVRIQVEHESAAASNTISDILSLTDPAVTATGGHTFNGGQFVEGETTTAQTLATFTDPGGAEATTDYSATINWGDTVTADTSASITQVSGATFAVVASHAYAEESAANHTGSNPYTISVTVHHEGASDANVVTDRATVSDPAVTATGGFTFTTGHFVRKQTSAGQTLATFTDPGGAEGTTDYSATIDWGDGNTADASATITQVSGATFAVVASHDYADTSGNPYTISVKVHHEGVDATAVTDTATVTVGVTPTYAVADFQGQGVWRFLDATGQFDAAILSAGDTTTTGWIQLTPSDATHVAVDASGDVVAVFAPKTKAFDNHVDPGAEGVYRWEASTGWVKLGPGVADDVAIANSGTAAGVYVVGTYAAGGYHVDSASVGIWRWDDVHQFEHLNAVGGNNVPAAIAGLHASIVGIDSSANVVGEFPGQGVWRYNDASTQWEHRTVVDASLLQLASNGILAGEFPGSGVWELTPTTDWTQVETQDVTALSVNKNNIFAVVFQDPSLVAVYRFTAPLTDPSGLQKLNGVKADQVRIADSDGIFASFSNTGPELLYYYNATTDQWEQAYPPGLAETAASSFFAD